MQTEYAIVGGGVVGLSIAYGLLKQGRRVTVFDEGDGAHRASRGNFGLVWVQGKGLSQPAYARWTLSSAAAWQAFANDLEQQTDLGLSLEQRGGYSFHLTEEALHKRHEELCGLKEQLGGDYPFDMLGHNALREEEPNIGPKVAGAILHHRDGHVNSLQLLKALSMVVRQQGAIVHNNATVKSITPLAKGFSVNSLTTGEVTTEKVILAAGIGSAKLGPPLGFKALVRAQRGQVLITEKIPKLINRPSDVTRQVNEGGVQIGASSEEVGPDDRETLSITARLAQDAITLYPALARVNLVRSWAALRIMSPDGLPIYQQSQQYPGAYFVTCHSGITLAAAHSTLLPLWLEGQAGAPDLSAFGEARFDV